jgi:aspartyl-tRNA(Asn)/glutamyl-tRNA(Gln) amidotransferase subunit B
VSSEQLSALLKRIGDGTISGKGAKVVFEELVAQWRTHRELARGVDAPAHPRGETSGVDQIIASKGLQQISDSAAIERIVDDVLAANANQVADYKSGKQKAFNSLVGQVMKATQGKANPAQVNDLLRKKLEA